MATFHYLHFRAFCHETEDPEKVKTALRNVAQAKALEIEETFVEGTHKNRIVILEAETKNAAAARALFLALRNDDPEGFARFRAQAPHRVDENLNLHLRLDKQAAFLAKTQLAQDEDAITVRGKIRSFEAKRTGRPLEASLLELEAFLQGLDRSSPSTAQ